MGARFRSWGVGAVLAVAWVMVGLPGRGEAHPNLIGEWSSRVPAGGYTSYRFGPGCYLGAGLWRGPYTYVLNGNVVLEGEYELRLYSGNEGTLRLIEGYAAPGGHVGTLDFATRTFNYLNATFRP